VNPGLRLTLVLAGAAAAALGVLTLTFLRRWRRKSPEEMERQRRLEVNRHGRIAAGHIADVVDSETSGAPARLIVYTYEVAGVTYEVAQDVTALPALVSAARDLAGQAASVKYDPRTPTNSIIACEEWCGVKDINPLGH
jgi:hypothetical protein